MLCTVLQWRQNAVCVLLALQLRFSVFLVISEPALAARSLRRVEALSGRNSTALISSGHDRRQPERCGITHTCYEFGKPCPTNLNCYSDYCWEGKCANTPSCRPYGEMCYEYAPHACCTGECQPVTLIGDCLRLLGLSTDYSTHGGVNVDRQCESIGTCGHWPGVSPPPGPQSTPWGVDPFDLSSKYYNLPGITFRNAIVDKSRVIAKRDGQTYHDIAADTTKPSVIRDAGLIFFSTDSVVSRDMWNMFQMGPSGDKAETITWCVAPITRGGAGGGFFAAGRDCCSKEDGFYCGNSEDDTVKSGLVLTSELENYKYARDAFELADGKKVHGGGKGVDTELPIFVYMVSDYETEATKELPPEDKLYYYKTIEKTTWCVAPILRPDKDISEEVNFFAVGQDCCNNKGKFTCGDVDVAGAISGKTDVDETANYRNAMKVGVLKYGYKLPKSPMCVRWTKETLVAPPGDASHGPEIKMGKGAMVGYHEGGH